MSNEKLEMRNTKEQRTRNKEQSETGLLGVIFAPTLAKASLPSGNKGHFWGSCRAADTQETPLDAVLSLGHLCSLFFVHCSFLIVLCSLFIGCQDPLSQPTTIPPGKGSFSLSVAVARTILPETPTEFASYTLAFTATNGGTSLSEDRSPVQLSDPVYLEPGTYKLVVTAYLDGGKPAVRGSIEGLVINEGENTDQEIILRAIVDEGNGTFTYNVSFPAGLATAGVTIAEMDETNPLHEKSFLSGGSGTTAYTETVPLDAMYYDVVFTFEKADGQTLIWRELLHIYSNLESIFTKYFTDDDFYRTRHTVTFMDGSTELFDLRQNNVLHGAEADEPEDPINDGYEFGGWYSDGDCTEPYDFDTPVTDHLILYAKWIPIFTVTFDANAGIDDIITDLPAPVTAVRDGTTISKPSPDPSRTGYTFIGWYKEAAGNNAWDFDTDTVTANTTLYAQWTGNTADISITVEQITDISCDDIDGGTIYRNGSPKSIIFPSSISFEYMDTDAYTCEWTIDGVGDYAYLGLIQLSDDPSCTVDAKDPQYNSTGKHPVYLTVEKDGVPYSKTIWVTIEDGVPVAATGVTLDKTTLTLAVGDPLTGILTATIEPDDATNQNVTWTTSDDAIASISNGTATSSVVTAVSGGSVIITVTTADGGHTATCAVTVTQPVTGVTLSPNTLFLTVGFTETLTATVAPSNATTQNVTWESGNIGVATVTNGLVTAVGGGTAIITVRTANGNHTETCTVTVTAPTDIDDEDFGPGAAIRIFYVYNEDDWKAAKTAISGGGNGAAGNDKNYVINVMDDFTVTGATTTTFGSTSNIKVSLRGDRTLTLTGIGNLIRGGAGQTVILRGLTLQGNSGNGLPLVNMSGANSVFVMRSGEISGNTSYGSSGGGVSVLTSAAFTMYGGTISGNTCNGNGGGVYVNSASFTMHGGTISGNTANGTSNNQGGGGVWMNSGTVRIVTGTIYGNTEADEGLRNTANLGAALYHNGGTAQRGTFNGAGGTWLSSGNLAITDDTIRLVGGEYE